MEEDKIIVSFDEAVLQEEARLLEEMSNLENPKSDDYMKLLNRWKSMATIRTQNNKTNEAFDQKMEEIKFEREKLEFEKERFEKDLEYRKKELEEEYDHKSNELEMRNLEANYENGVKKRELDIREKELEQQKKDLKWKNILSGIGVGATVVLGFANIAAFLTGQRRDIKFSETGTYLNAYGRSHSNNASKLLNFSHKK